MKKILFINRDGTLVLEPLAGYQLDCLEKLEFYPKVFQYLSRIVKEMDYQLVLITTQPGLGTSTFLEEVFWPIQNKIIQAFKNEGIEFYEILIDKSVPGHNLPTQNTGIELFNHYLKGNYDLPNSYMIGDRSTDLQLADEFGFKAILFSKELNTAAALSTLNWEDVYHYLKTQPRTARLSRITSETAISININLDGTGKSNISTGLGFFDHMLDQIARHGNIDLSIAVKGDLNIDEHHTIEDVGLALGDAFIKALGSKKGIERYGFLLPMDDCLAQVAIDFGGRPWLVWEADFKREKIGDVPTEMFMYFFKSFSDNAKCNINIKAEGTNEHHKIEAIFKAFAKALNMAIQKTNNYNIPSTKGSL